MEFLSGSQAPAEPQEVTSTAPPPRDFLQSPILRSYFAVSRATATRLPVPPTVRVGSENIIEPPSIKGKFALF